MITKSRLLQEIELAGPDEFIDFSCLTIKDIAYDEVEDIYSIVFKEAPLVLISDKTPVTYVASGLTMKMIENGIHHITKEELLKKLEHIPNDMLLDFSGLVFYRSKYRGGSRWQIEFDEIIQAADM